jgi:hypothetical protein
MLWRRSILVVSAAIVLAAWGFAARMYAVDGGGGYSGGFGLLVFAAGGLTIGAAMLIVRGWHRRERLAPLYAALVSVLASLSILFMGAAINWRG